MAHRRTTMLALLLGTLAACDDGAPAAVDGGPSVDLGPRQDGGDPDAGDGPDARPLPDGGPVDQGAPLDAGPFPEACVALVMRVVACEIVPAEQAADSLRACDASDPTLRASRAACVAAAADCEGVFACLSAQAPDGGLDQGVPPDQGPDAAADQGASDQGAPDQGPAPCPAEWAVLDLNASPQGGGRFVAVGSTAGAPVQAGPASCGGGAGDHVYRFVPPAAGRWRLRTESDALDVDTVLSLRAGCLGPEVACNDDATPDQFTSAVEAALPADAPVWIVVDGLTNADTGYAWQGPYRLIAERAE